MSDFDIRAIFRRRPRAEPGDPGVRRPHVRFFGKLRTHSLAFLGYMALSVPLSWPLLRDFSGKAMGEGLDVFHNIWILWHVKEWFLGHQPLFEAPSLYYPVGISTLSHAVGPLLGWIALPFWPWGPIAANNGVLLIGLFLSGFGMYLLGLEVGMQGKAAFFAGTLLMVAPIHLAGLQGHMEKVFIGLLPLVILSVLRTFDLRRGAVWAILTAVFLLLTLFHNGLQFVMAVLAVGFFAASAILPAKPMERWILGKRLVLFAVSCLVLVGPLLLATARVARDPALLVNLNTSSVDYHPDVVELFLPPPWALLWREPVVAVLEGLRLDHSIETRVFLSWTGLLLALIALISRRKQDTAIWAIFTVCWTVLSLGPFLQALGRQQFTEYNLPVMLPYALLTALPGLEFLRTPGRLAMMSVIGLGVLAGFGLNWVNRRYPRGSVPVTALAVILVLLEVWPRPWPQSPLPEIPQFYRQLGEEEALYGVFDVPLVATEKQRPQSFSARHQMLQMTHRKGIFGGYLARVYETHPVFPCLVSGESSAPDLRVDGRPSDCLGSALRKMAFFGYRYVVRHKPQSGDGNYPPGSPGEQASLAFVKGLFGDEPAVVDDALVTVYPVPPLERTVGSSPEIWFTGNWYDREESWRWARSPASLRVFTPQPFRGSLILDVSMVYDPASGAAASRRVSLSLDGRVVSDREIMGEQATAFPLELGPGYHTIELSLDAGNFRPSDQGGSDQRWLSFATRSVELRTEPAGRVDPDSN